MTVGGEGEQGGERDGMGKLGRERGGADWSVWANAGMAPSE